jgi:hypothetical protein
MKIMTKAMPVILMLSGMMPADVKAGQYDRALEAKYWNSTPAHTTFHENAMKQGSEKTYLTIRNRLKIRIPAEIAELGGISPQTQAEASDLSTMLTYMILHYVRPAEVNQKIGHFIEADPGLEPNLCTVTGCESFIGTIIGNDIFMTAFQGKEMVHIIQILGSVSEIYL